MQPPEGNKHSPGWEKFLGWDFQIYVVGVTGGKGLARTGKAASLLLYHKELFSFCIETKLSE